MFVRIFHITFPYLQFAMNQIFQAYLNLKFSSTCPFAIMASVTTKVLSTVEKFAISYSSTQSCTLSSCTWNTLGFPDLYNTRRLFTSLLNKTGTDLKTIATYKVLTISGRLVHRCSVEFELCDTRSGFTSANSDNEYAHMYSGSCNIVLHF